MPCPRKIHDYRCKAACRHPDVVAERRRVVEHLYLSGKAWQPTPTSGAGRARRRLTVPVRMRPDQAEKILRRVQAAIGRIAREAAAAGHAEREEPVRRTPGPRFSRPRPDLGLRDGSLTVNRARLEHRRGRLGRPGLELFGEVYAALLDMKFWRQEDFRRWDTAATDCWRQRASRSALRSPWEFYLWLHSDDARKHLTVNAKTWRPFVEKYLVRSSPGLRWLEEHDPQVVGRLAEELGRFARSGGGGRRPRHRTPEALAIALTAAALQKDLKSVARRVNLEQAPRSVSFVPRPER